MAGRYALQPSQAVPATGSYKSKAEDGLLKVLRHRVEQTTFVRKTRDHLSPLKSELPGGDVDTTGIAAYLMEQIPDRASHIFDPRSAVHLAC
jgi:hypothetical protein